MKFLKEDTIPKHVKGRLSKDLQHWKLYCRELTMVMGGIPMFSYSPSTSDSALDFLKTTTVQVNYIPGVQITALDLYSNQKRMYGMLSSFLRKFGGFHIEEGLMSQSKQFKRITRGDLELVKSEKMEGVEIEEDKERLEEFVQHTLAKYPHFAKYVIKANGQGNAEKLVANAKVLMALSRFESPFQLTPQESAMVERLISVSKRMQISGSTSISQLNYVCRDINLLDFKVLLYAYQSATSSV